nr:dienelactone hydrolase family protein [Pseudomonas sp. D8002]
MDALADSERLRMRFEAGLELLRRQPQVSDQQVAAIGYCFGGRVVLDMARQGLDLIGVASFHGLLGTDTPAIPGMVKAVILVAHGDADELVSESDLSRFEVEMYEAGVRYSLKRYSGALHSYSNPASPNYRKVADQRSWADLMEFLRQLFDQDRSKRGLSASS